MHKIFRIFLMILALLLPGTMWSQYSQDAYKLKGMQDLFDQRGIGQGVAVSIDGKLAVNNQNGGLNYVYPISSYYAHGHQVVSAISYCPAIQVTAFKDYSVTDRHLETPYEGWAQQHQSRPGWIYSVGGWAINVLAVASNVSLKPGSTAFNSLATEFDDSHMHFLVDGYHFTNRMRDFGADDNRDGHYRDVIRLLRGDGSVLELLNINTPADIGYGDPDTVARLTTGFYFSNEANARGYAVVSYDTTMLTGSLRDYIHQSVQDPDERYPVTPRVLRYFAGDGTVAIFREKFAPFGLASLKDYNDRSGGIWGHPTIFYLDEIRGNSGTIVEFHRPRHQRRFDNGKLVDQSDETRGRALTTSYTQHTLSFGFNSLTVQAMGRTTKILFNTIHRSGTASANEVFPWANLGGNTVMTQDMVGYDQLDDRLYKGFWGMVTEIRDENDRRHLFTYEQYSKKYQGFGFPRAGNYISVLLKNYRLKTITEPSAKYEISYHGDRNAVIVNNALTLAVNLNTMVDSVRKYDRSGTLLTTDRYEFPDASEVGNILTSTQTTTDHITGHVRRVDYTYHSFPLLTHAPILTPGRHTVLTQTLERAGGVQTTSTTTYATSATMPSWGGHGHYTVLPVSQVTLVNGIPKSHQEFSYQLDTLRKFWPADSLNGKFGMEITRKVTRTLKPNQPSKLLLADTTEFLHLQMKDTTLTWYEGKWDKFKTIAKYLYLRDTLQHPEVIGKSWEYLSLRPPVVVYTVDTITERTLVPPVFGLPEKSWTTDTAGVVTGVRNVYRTDVMQGNLRAQRGLLLADSIIGSNGKRMLKGEYTYRREWNGDLLASTRNAVGAEQSYSYNYQTCEDLLFWQHCDGSSQPTGKIISNDATTREYKLQWSPFPYLFAKPAMERQVVRRYSIGGTLQKDTLTNFIERTFHGLASATLDDNGYVSQSDYDYAGRLRTAWLPRDYAGAGVLDTLTYSGPEPGDLLGTTYQHRRIDTVHCYLEGQDQIPSDSIITGLARTTINPDTLIAAKPLTRVPQCPVLVNGQAEEKGPSRQLQTIYQRRMPFDEYNGYKGFVGVLPHRLDASSPIKKALRLDSLRLELMVTSVEGTCVHLEIAIDSIFTKTFVLNCESEQDPGGDDPPKGEAKQTGRELQGGDITPVAGGYKLLVNLSSVAGQLRGRPTGSSADIELRVKTSGATVVFVNGTNSDDLRPRLLAYGEYRKIWDRADYTLAFEHNDADLTTTEYSKVDDARHTNNDLASQGITVRRSSAKNFFGADYRLLKSERKVVETDSLGNSVTRTDLSRQRHSGLGAVLTGIDAEGDSVVTRYDALGRPVETINTDGSRSTIQYVHGRADSLGITDQDFFGYCDLTITTDENGLKDAQFRDAFGRVRREVTDYGTDPTNLNLTTTYEYDVMGRLVRVRNPKGQVTAYEHDDFGRVIGKRQPDLGRITYAHDAVGNVRFIQDQKQAESNLVTFNQHDDLGRLTLMGEAYIDETGTCAPYDENNPYAQGCGDGTRLTDKLDPNVLHVAGGSILTANRKMFVSPVRQPNSVTDLSTFRLSDCDELQPEPRLGESEPPTLPLIVHPARFYNLSGGIPGSPLEECEDIALHPEFARMAVAYDTLPLRNGTVWKNFPPYAQWHALAPTGKVRNQRGREAAVAYRELASNPFHYAVTSYDERGRVEALLRFTENIGFDAVYYTYNSSNQITGVTVADPVRKFSSWYGFDHQGRVDTVWSKLYPPGSGLSSDGTFASLRYPGVDGREGVAPEIVYSYTKLDRVKQMRYPALNVLVDYAYNSRGFLDSLVARRSSGAQIFAQRLIYDSSAQILQQHYRHGAGTSTVQHYGYDAAHRLIWWNLDGNGDFTEYQYDAVGSRLRTTKTGAPDETYTYYPGTNRLSFRHKGDGSGNDTLRMFEYDANGARRLQETGRINGNQTIPLREEHFNYSFRGLLNRAKVRNIGEPWEDWRYAYAPGGERESRRMYAVEGDVSPAPDSTVWPWVYYLLGGGGSQQFAVYHGQHLDSLQTECGDAGQNRVYIYAREYLAYGTGDAANLIFRSDGRKEYKITDHLGSTRVVLDNTGQVITRIDNAPFGEQIAVTGVESRKSFIDKELDRESTTYNTGVRQYDPEVGFTSVDPRWEQFRDITPYHYSYNNPLAYKDPNGEEPGPVIYALIEIGLTGYDIYETTKTVFFDPNATTRDKTLSVVGLGVGVLAPGGGYGKIAKEGPQVIDNAISSVSKVIKSTDEGVDAAKAGSKMAKAAEPKGGVYVMPHKSTGEVMRTGRTCDFLRREREHSYNPLLKDLEFKPVYKTDNYKAQRGLEQMVHDTYKPPLNKVNPISPKNKKKSEYMGEAKKFLEAIP